MVPARWWACSLARRARQADDYEVEPTGRPSQQPSRRFAAGIIALRPDRDGRISHYDGVDAVQRHFGEWIIDMHLPNPGTPTQPVSAGYMANAWMRFRHPDYDELRKIMDTVGQTVKVRAQ